MRIELLAASARGPGHEQLGTGNEDAWIAARLTGGSVIAVADGMGSKPEAAVGARTACDAAVVAMDLWWRGPAQEVQALPDLIEATWRAWLGRVDPSDARSTCLVAGISDDGSLVVAALGDGIVLVVDERDEVDVVTDERTGFGNETYALGDRGSRSPWRLRVTPQVGPGTAVLLATDGVADDLLPEARAGFARHVISSFGGLPEWERGFALWRELRDWPTPGHSDDKTVAVMWCEP